MANAPLSKEDVTRRGYELYAQHIRKIVETEENIGKIVVINVETGEYEVDANAMAATDRAFTKHADAPLLRLRIGYDVVDSFSGSPLRKVKE